MHRLISDESVNEEVNNRFYAIENEIDIRVESIIMDLNKNRDELRKELNEMKDSYSKYFC